MEEDLSKTRSFSIQLENRQPEVETVNDWKATKELVSC
jgi:hypothetical protein